MNNQLKNESTIPGIYIPGEVLYNPELTLTEQKLFGMLLNLAKTDKGCWATNKYLSSLLGIRQQTVTNGVSKLQKYGYLKVEFRTKFKYGKQITNRFIFINENYIKTYTPLANYLNDCFVNAYCIDFEKVKMILKLIFKKDGGISTDDGGYHQIDNEYKNLLKYFNNESKDSFNAFSSEKAETKRKRKRKKKTLESTPEQKIKYIENKSLVEYWNEQPNLRTHRIDLNNPSKTFIKSLELLNKMQKGKLFKRSQLHDDMLFNVPEDNYVKPYSVLDIRQAIKTLNDWHKPGNQPVNKKCLQGLSLPDAIRNDRNGTSFLIQALYKGVQSVYDPLKGLSEEEQKAYKLMEEFFLEYKKMETLPNTLSKQILKWIEDSKKITNRPINAYTSMIVSALRKKRSENFNDYLFNELNLKLFTVMTTKALYPGANTFEKIKDAFKHTESIDLLTESNQYKNKVSKSEQKWLNIVKEMYFREQNEKQNNEEITQITNGNDEVIGWIVRGSNGTKDKIIEEIYKEGDVVRYYTGSSKRNKIKKEIHLRDNN